MRSPIHLLVKSKVKGNLGNKVKRNSSTERTQNLVGDNDPLVRVQNQSNERSSIVLRLSRVPQASENTSYQTIDSMRSPIHLLEKRKVKGNLGNKVKRNSSTEKTQNTVGENDPSVRVQNESNKRSSIIVLSLRLSRVPQASENT
ncbi:hypothetical protein AVEN_37690-1 [Araneus ventricosus]|uniref:Uncharacterized protein n=1 Tax=Araneus ventricosus TaxID=182803 RepID=A0A4Y2GGB6_ARAVE|nr:hypothetical protein AVEN_37690-1 [Araneus ventricosus]